MNCRTNKRNLLTAMTSACACCVICSVCWAQPPIPKGPPPPRGSNESREFWTILGEAYKDANNNRRDLWRLVEHPVIQTEIELTSEEFKAIEALNFQHMDEIRQLRDEYVKKPDKQVCIKELIELLNQQDAAFTQKLSQVAQIERLQQINVQVYGNRAATQVEIATRIGLSNEKLIEIRHLTDKVRREEFEKMGDTIRDIMRGGQQNGKRLRDTFRQIDDKVDEAIKIKLTTQQLDALQQLKGPAFEIPEDLFDRRRRDGNRNDKDRDNKGGDKKQQEKDDCANSFRFNCYRHKSC